MRGRDRSPRADDFPLDAGQLDRLRIRARKRARRSQLGAHRRRTLGQSLEFREHRGYLAGDDFRHIDWRASARRPRVDGSRSNLLVRRYAAEERQTIAISIDNRATMFLPDRLRKLTIATWIGRAVATIAGRTGDDVLLHRLFGPRRPSQSMRGRAVLPATIEFMRQLESEPTDHARLDLSGMTRLLRPTTIWIVISDFYFDDPDGLMLRALIRAQRSLCWVITVDLDSWPAERRALLRRPTLVTPTTGGEPIRTELDAAQARIVERRIGTHKDALFDPARRGGIDRCVWHWPEQLTSDCAERLFCDRLFDDPVVTRIFRREP